MTTDLILPDLNEDSISYLNEVSAIGPTKVKQFTDFENDHIVRILILNYNYDKFVNGRINKIDSNYGVSSR